MKDLLINVSGGTGYHMALSQVMKEAKAIYNKIYVIAPYKDLFELNENVDYVYAPEQARDAFEDIDIENTEIITGRVYDFSDFVKKQLNYDNAFRKWLGLPMKENKLSELKSELKETPLVKQYVDAVLKDIKDKGFEDFIIIQGTGGQSPLTPVPLNEKQQHDWFKVPYEKEQQGLKRYYDKMGEFVKLFQEAHPKTAVVVYQLPNEGSYENCLQYQVPYIVYHFLAKEAKGTVSIDSSLQHIVSGQTRSVVIWAHTIPESFGYAHNVNIVQYCNRDSIRFFSLLGKASNRVDEVRPEVLLKIVNGYIFGKDKPRVIYTDKNGGLINE